MKNLGGWIATTILVLAQVAPAAAEPKSNFPDLEQKLGKGWQCFAMPNGFGHVGVVFEQRQDQQVFYLDDTKSAAAATAQVSIGTLTTSKHLSLAAAVKLLSVFFPSIDASYDNTTKVTATIGGAEEQVGGVAVSDAGKAWATAHLSSFKSGSKLFIVREAVLASEVTYAFDAATSTSISAKLDLSAPKSATVTASAGVGGKSPTASATATASTPTGSTKTADAAKTTDAVKPTVTDAPTTGPASGDKSGDKQSSTVSPPDSAHRIAQTFNPKIGICIHPDQIVLGNNYGGAPKPSIVPVTQDLDFRHPTGPR